MCSYELRYSKCIGSKSQITTIEGENITPSRFEDLINEASGDFSADIKYGDEFVECKSWGGNQPGMGNVPTQMINYFNTQTSFDNFHFQFDTNPGRWVPTATDLNIALKANKDLFKLAKWEEYRNMFNFTDFEVTPDDLVELINFITTNKYNNIINPNK